MMCYRCATAISLLLGAFAPVCALAQPQDGVTGPSAATKRLLGAAEAARTGRRIQLHYSGGRVVSATARANGAAILSADFTAANSAAAVLKRVKRWAVVNRRSLRLAKGIRARHFALAPAAGAVLVDKNVKIYRYDQSYRGLRVAGPEAMVSVMIAGDRDVRSILGGFVDQRPEYAGLEGGITEATARQMALAAWKAHAGGPPRSRPGGAGGQPQIGALVALPPGPGVGRLQKVAVPEHEAIAWRAEILGPGLSAADTILGQVLLAATDGAVLAVAPASAAVAATVRAHEMKDDPFTTAKKKYPNVPATIYGNTVNLSPSVVGSSGAVTCTPASSREYRLGDSQRLTVFDFAKSLDDPKIRTVEACSQDPAPFFGASLASSNRFRAQDMLVKTNAALAVLDPLKGEMVTHGAAHTYSWDHHPDVPEIIHRPTLALFANHGEGSDGCDGNSGIIRQHWAEEGSVWFDPLETPVWHPGIFTADHKALVAEISVCSTSFNGSLFHEIGHYYDAFSAYGVLGESGPGYSECCLDRPNEARAMAESIAQLFSLFLMERLYGDLNYTLSAMPDADDACKLSALTSHMPGSIVHPDCIDDADLIWTLNEKRPTGNNATFGCNPSGNAYDVHAQSQAFWSLLFGRQCSVTPQNGVACARAHTPLPGGYSVRWMEALLAALEMGNLHSFVSLWDNIEAYIGANYPADLSFLQSVRALHGLEPLPHGLDPGCDCPQLNGCG